MKRRRNERRKPASKNDENLQEELLTQIQGLDANTVMRMTKFSELPLSPETQKGLQSAKLSVMTEIQRECIFRALQGKDILGAARTGSGKTLAFLIPLVERLYHENWSHLDGLGALVITPTRELALQSFQVLRKIGKFHTFSAGLLIGGKSLKEERERVSRMNILICTPGRLLQHMDETPGFETNNLQMLILDEADRVMDMGFKKTIDNIIANLTAKRQTLLFSATQTKSVKDLARLSLSNPEYISVDEEAPTSTPKLLEQFYIVNEVDQKLDNFWSFIRSHISTKILVFVSSSKQVRFIYESFRHLRPGIPLIQLHGRQKQNTRIDAVDKFSRLKYACLIATDLVARGIDFPAVDWVVQLDCPEDASTYIHRVGRSARAGKAGNALLFLTPSEEQPFIANLKARKVPINKLTIREAKRRSIQPDLQAQCFKDPEIKYLAQKAFVSYVRSIVLQHDKNVFKIEAIPMEQLASSFGLAGVPEVTVKGRHNMKAIKNRSYALQNLMKEMKQGETDIIVSKTESNTGNENDDDDAFIKIKRRDHSIQEVPELVDVASSNRALKRALSKKQKLKEGGLPTKTLFDEAGNPHALYEFQHLEDFNQAGDAEAQRRGFVETEIALMEQHDIEDKAALKELRDRKKQLRKLKEREARMQSDSEAGSYEPSDVEESSSDEELEIAEGPPQQRPHKANTRERPVAKRPKLARPDVIEFKEPNTLEDFESLTQRLLRG